MDCRIVAVVSASSYVAKARLTRQIDEAQEAYCVWRDDQEMAT